MEMYQNFAVNIARQAGALLETYARQPIRYHMKTRQDIQADADLASERLIIDAIATRFPEHGVFAEETGKNREDAEFVWIIDPLDGTINFARGIKDYCVSIALTHYRQVVLGVVYQPELDKLFVAERGRGASLNGGRLKVSAESELINGLIATDNSSDLTARLTNFALMAAFADKVRHVRIFGSTALHLAKIACGQLDLYYKARMNYWDCAAACLLVEEAGGKVTDFAGNHLDAASRTIIASNARLHDAALTHLHQTLKMLFPVNP